MSDPHGYDDALRGLEDEQDPPQFIRWESNNYRCILGDATLTKNLGFGGYTPDTVLVAVVRRSALGTDLPQLKDDIVANGRGLHLDSIRTPPCGTFFVYGLTEPAKGA